jgi:hypothetical protein
MTTVKEKLWNYITEKRLWMRNGDLKSVETSSIGWLVGAHPALVFRPSIEQELNRLVAELPLELREEMVALHGNPNETDNLPPFFVNQREHAFGFEKDRVATSALTVSCVSDRATRLMKELLSNVKRQDLSYMFIPLGMPTMEAQQAYKKFIIRNNDKINAVQGLSVKGFSDELFSRTMDPEDNDSQTVQEYLFTHPAIQTIENTNLTEEKADSFLSYSRSLFTRFVISSRTFASRNSRRCMLLKTNVTPTGLHTRVFPIFNWHPMRAAQ